MVQMMSRVIVGSLLLVHMVAASKYGSSNGGGAGGGGGGEAIYLSSGGGASHGGGNGGGLSDGGAPMDINSMFGLTDYAQSSPSYQSAGPVSAAIQTKRTVEVKPVNIPHEPVEPHVVDVEATYQPVHVIFRSSSSPVMVQQIHTPAQPAQVESTQSEDQPHRVQHSVVRPVIQEVREIITPYRRVLQEIRPVQEEVRTVVAKAESNGGRSAGGAGVGGSLGGGDGSGLSSYGSSASLGSGSGVLSSVGSGSGSVSSLGAYGSAAASVVSPSYSTRGRRSSLVSHRVGGSQRKTYRRAAMAKRPLTYAYASSL